MPRKRSACSDLIAIIILSSLLSTPARAQDSASNEMIDELPVEGESQIALKYKATLEKPPNVEWFLGAELGFLAVVSHIVQLSNDGTRFDYRDEGGQDVLFPFFRLSTDLKFKGRHTIVFLYQPLKLTGETVLSQDTTFDGIVFPAGTPLNSTYGFPFWRISYLYDFLRRPGDEVSIGVSLQIRNATITFTSADGTLRADRRDIGPVPALKFRGRWGFESGVWWGTEIDGIYAPISGINGSDEEITGALLDASLRVGYDFTDRVAGFFNLRYLGGGAVGTESNPSPPSDGYTKNWLHFITVSLGVEFRAIAR
ncbi:MAG: hypothetical protein ACERNK_08915 [Deltaproteobacteria bacterium]|jgi:hypothetical protein